MTTATMTTATIDRLLAEYARLNGTGNLKNANSVMIGIVRELVRLIGENSQAVTNEPPPPPSATGTERRVFSVHASDSPPAETLSHSGGLNNEIHQRRDNLAADAAAATAPDAKPAAGEPFPVGKIASATPEGAAAYADQLAILHAASPEPNDGTGTPAVEDEALAVARLTVAEIADALGAEAADPAQHAASRGARPKPARKA